MGTFLSVTAITGSTLHLTLIHSFIAVHLGTCRPANTMLSDDSWLVLMGQSCKTFSCYSHKMSCCLTLDRNSEVMLTRYYHSANTPKSECTLQHTVFNKTAPHFGKYACSLSRFESDEKIDTSLMSVRYI